MSSSYYKRCDVCGRQIQLRQMPGGQWVAFEGFDTIHKHEKPTVRTRTSSDRTKRPPAMKTPPRYRADRPERSRPYDDLSFPEIEVPGTAKGKEAKPVGKESSHRTGRPERARPYDDLDFDLDFQDIEVPGTAKDKKAQPVPKEPGHRDIEAPSSTRGKKATPVPKAPTQLPLPPSPQPSPSPRARRRPPLPLLYRIARTLAERHEFTTDDVHSLAVEHGLDADNEAILGQWSELLTRWMWNPQPAMARDTRSALVATGVPSTNADAAMEQALGLAKDNNAATEKAPSAPPAYIPSTAKAADEMKVEKPEAPARQTADQQGTKPDPPSIEPRNKDSCLPFSLVAVMAVIVFTLLIAKIGGA